MVFDYKSLVLLALIASCVAGSAALCKPVSGSKLQAQPADTSSTRLPESTAARTSGGLDVSKPYGYHLTPILEKIKASSEQRTKIVAIVQSYRCRIEPLRDEYKQRKEEFMKDITQPTPAEEIMSKQLELSHLSTDISSKYTLMRLEIRRLLAPGQILLFEEYARQHGWNNSR